MLPGSILYVVGSDAVARALAEGRGALTAVGILLTDAALLGRFARRKLQMKEKEEDKG